MANNPGKWIVYRPDGGWEQFTANPDHADDHPRLHYPDDHEFVKVDRHTNDPLGERHDRQKKAWVKVELTREQRLSRHSAELGALSREQYMHKVIRTLFPDLKITQEQMEELFPDVLLKGK